MANRELFDAIKNGTINEEEKDNKKYRLIDDALCDVNPNIDAYENCKDCPYFFDCMEEDLED
jgi:hypothetical protein